MHPACREQSKLIPREERDMPECQHSDFCRGYRADFMTYRLPRMETGFVLMCCVKYVPVCCVARTGGAHE